MRVLESVQCGILLLLGVHACLGPFVNWPDECVAEVVWVVSVDFVRSSDRSRQLRDNLYRRFTFGDHEQRYQFRLVILPRCQVKGVL